MTTAAASVEMSAILVLICIDNASMLDCYQNRHDKYPNIKVFLLWQDNNNMS